MVTAMSFSSGCFSGQKAKRAIAVARHAIEIIVRRYFMIRWFGEGF
jgi:hypothetical protein